MRPTDPRREARFSHSLARGLAGRNPGVALPANCDTGNWAASSVTDGYGCLWAMPSVCIADAAVFPTSGAHNPNAHDHGDDVEKRPRVGRCGGAARTPASRTRGHRRRGAVGARRRSRERLRWPAQLRAPTRSREADGALGSLARRAAAPSACNGTTASSRVARRPKHDAYELRKHLEHSGWRLVGYPLSQRGTEECAAPLRSLFPPSRRSL
jgi:hypothetical protein